MKIQEQKKGFVYINLKYFLCLGANSRASNIKIIDRYPRHIIIETVTRDCNLRIK